MSPPITAGRSRPDSAKLPGSEGNQSSFWPIRCMNSSLVRGSLRKAPEKAEVVVSECSFCTPLSLMQVWALYYDCRPEGLERGIYAFKYLGSKPFLDLETAGITFDHAGNLAETGYPAVRDVCHMGLAYEGKHVVFAGRIELDILYQNHLAVFFFKQGPHEDFTSVLEISVRQELYGLRDPFGGFQQALTGRVLPYQFEDGLIMFRQFCGRFFVVAFYFPVCHCLELFGPLFHFPKSRKIN